MNPIPSFERVVFLIVTQGCCGTLVRVQSVLPGFLYYLKNKHKNPTKMFVFRHEQCAGGWNL